MDEIFQIGLIGFPVEHSNSPKIFQQFFDQLNLSNWEYQLFPTETLTHIESFLSNHPRLIGFNVTIPHKITIFPFLSQISPEAKSIGAVNTVKILRENDRIYLEGHNTDYFGFEESLKKLPRKPNSALILGDGGAAKSVKAVLKDYKIPFLSVSRNPSETQLNYSDLENLDWNSTDLLIQTTPLGMWPKVDQLPNLPYHLIASKTMAIDLIYNPKQTLFLKKLESQNCFCLNGELMLQKQAEKAWEIFYTP